MLNFSNFLNSAKEHFFCRSVRLELNSSSCKYLLSLQKHSKIFKQEEEIYLGIIDALGFSGLKIAAEYIERNIKRYSSIKTESRLIIASVINEKKNLSLVERWNTLHKLVISAAAADVPWCNRTDDVFHFLLRHKSFEMRGSPKSIFDKRLDMLCKTLDLSDVSKELLRLIYSMNYNDAIDDLTKSLCDNRRINYAALGILLNYPEEKILEVVSGERGLRDFGLMDSEGLDFPEEIRKYLKGLGSDNLMDIYATVDKKEPLPIEKFEYQKEAKFIIDLISVHKNDRPLHFLLYGMEGTGKTELTRTIAAYANCSLLDIGLGNIKKQIFGEKINLEDAIKKFRLRALNIAEIMFRDKSNVILLIDEADSLISDRRSASHSWETTQVNEFLVQLENSKCLVVCSTNFQGKLDAASNRRFHFHLKFDYLQREGILKMAQNFFPELKTASWAELCQVECLAPGDFYAVYKRLQWLPKEELSAALVTKELSEVAMAKEPYGNRRIGFARYESLLPNIPP